MRQLLAPILTTVMLAGPAGGVRGGDAARETPARVPEPVQIAMADGTNVNGRFVMSGDGRRGVLLFSMCQRGAIDGWTPLVDRLAANGISSLTVTSPNVRPLAAGPSGETNTRASDGDVLLATLAARLAPAPVLAVGGGSCGVHLALLAATRHAASVRAAVVLSGPYDDALRQRVSELPGLAMFSGASRSEGPAIGWAEGLRAASRHPDSRVLIREGSAHGTDMFADDPALAAEVARWIAERLL
jgi:hypothetical protein